MKLFLVSASNVGYDEYDSFVIIAESKEQVQEILNKDLRWYERNDVDIYKVGNECMPCFNAEQAPITVEEIKIEDLKKPTVICASYNAG